MKRQNLQDDWPTRLATKDQTAVFGKNTQHGLHLTFPELITSRPGIPNFELTEGHLIEHYRSAWCDSGWEAAPSLYISYPFNAQNCPVCLESPPPNKYMAENYLHRLSEEIKDNSDHELFQLHNVKSIFLDGGWIRNCNPQEIVDLIDELRQHYALANDVDICSNIRIEDDQDEKLMAIIDAGVTSLRISAFSLQPENINRRHKMYHPHQALDFIDKIKATGHMSIALEMNYGLPFQNLESLQKELSLSLHSGVDAIFLNQVAPETACLGNLVTDTPDLETRCQMYTLAHQTLAQGRTKLLESGHFSITGRYRNIFHHSIFHRDPIFGFGANASTRIGPYRWQNTSCLSDYIKSKECKPLRRAFANNSYHRLFNDIQNQLDMGYLDLEDLHQCHEINLWNFFKPLVEQWETNGLIVTRGKQITLTLHGRYWWATLATIIINLLEHLFKES